jgi:hypothetical protein
MYIVMTACAKMPGSCRGTYRRVAVLNVLSYDYNRDWRPAMISDRARGVYRVIDLGHHSVGKTERCAYQRALARAEQMAHDLNAAGDAATVEDIIGAGGSA